MRQPELLRRLPGEDLDGARGLRPQAGGVAEGGEAKDRPPPRVGGRRRPDQGEGEVWGHFRNDGWVIFIILLVV